MTFWQDARPASPRFRMPRRPEPRRSWSPKRRRGALVIAAVLIATAGVSVVRAGADDEAGAEARPRKEPSARPSPARPTVIPARWAETLPDQAATMVVDAGAAEPEDAIVIGDRSITSVAIADGTRRWTTPVPDVGSSAVLRGPTLLISTTSGFAALERATGKIRWRTTTTETPGPVALVGPDGTPQIAVVSTDEGGLVGLDTRTGRPRWSTRFVGWPRGAFAVDDASGTVAAVWRSGLTGMLRVVDGATGSLRWERPTAVMSGSVVITDGLAVVGAGLGPSDSEVRAFALADGTLRWRTPVAAPFQEDLVPLADGRDLYVVDELGTVARIDLKDGTRRWSTATRRLEVYVRPIRVDDAILVWNEAGEVVTLDRVTGAIRARRQPAGLPVGLAAGHGYVVVTQRLVDRDTIQAFDAARMAAPARRGR